MRWTAQVARSAGVGKRSARPEFRPDVFTMSTSRGKGEESRRRAPVHLIFAQLHSRSPMNEKEARPPPTHTAHSVALPLHGSQGRSLPLPFTQSHPIYARDIHACHAHGPHGRAVWLSVVAGERLAQMVTSSGKLRNMSSRSMTSFASSGVHTAHARAREATRGARVSARVWGASWPQSSRVPAA